MKRSLVIMLIVVSFFLSFLITLYGFLLKRKEPTDKEIAEYGVGGSDSTFSLGKWR